MTTIINDGTAPNRCTTCPRTSCSLFDGRCGNCAFGVSGRADDIEVTMLRMNEQLLLTEISLLREQNARLLASMDTLASSYSHHATSNFVDPQMGLTAA